jgi:predicted enzyme related to lactoylglutathione lyase
MPEFTKHEPGTHSWADLSAADIDSAIKLYTDLFGWDVTKEDLPDGGVYAMFRINGKDIAAAGPLQEEQAKMGIPPHWNVYVTVEDAEQASKQAEAAGGTIVVPAFDVMEFGRMAVIADPTGAIFNVWEPKTNIGAHVLGETNTISWTELSTSDTNKAGEFYKEVFGYTLTPFGPDGSYTVFTMGDKQIAGMMQVPTEQMRPNWLVYFNVEDPDDVTKKVKAAGGRAYLEPGESEGVGRFAVLADPQGAAFGVIRPQPQSS